jgi:hypothetical protein
MMMKLCSLYKSPKISKCPKKGLDKSVNVWYNIITVREMINSLKHRKKVIL